MLLLVLALETICVCYLFLQPHKMTSHDDLPHCQQSAKAVTINGHQ